MTPTRRVDTKPQKKVQQTRNSRRSAPVDDFDDPPPRGRPPVVVPIGLGIGIGGMGRPNYGGGMRPGGSGTHSTPPRRYPNN